MSHIWVVLHYSLLAPTMILDVSDSCTILQRGKVWIPWTWGFPDPCLLLLPHYPAILLIFPIILLIFPSDAAPLIKELLGCSNYSYLVQYFLFCQILQYFPFLQNFAKFPLFAKLQYRCLSCICCFSCWGRELVPNWPWIIFLKSGRNHHLGSRSRCGWAERAGGGSKVQPCGWVK